MSKKAIIISIILCLSLIGVLLINKPKISSVDAKLFSYLFGAVTNSSNQDIDTILSNSDEEERLFDLFIYIGDKSNYGEDFKNCSETEQNFYMLYNFHDEVGCGGVEQFIYNNYYNHEYALESFIDMGLPVTSDYLQQAINIYPSKRIDSYSNIELSDRLSAIDDEFYDRHAKEFYNFIYDYVEQHLDEFEEQKQGL